MVPVPTSVMHLSIAMAIVTATPPLRDICPPEGGGGGGGGWLQFDKSNAPLLETNNWLNDPSFTQSRYVFDTFYNLRFRSSYSKLTRVNLCRYTADIVPL